MKITKRLLPVLLAFVLVFSLSMTALASDTDLTNFTKETNELWTTVVTAGASTTIDVGPANLSYVYTGFSTSTAAANVSWSINFGSALINSYSSAPFQMPGGDWVNRLTVNTNSGVQGTASFHAVNTNAGAQPTATVDMTVAIEPSSVTEDPVLTEVYVVDVSGSPTDVIVDDESVDVYASVADPISSLLNITLGKSSAYQNVPSAMNTLNALLYSSYISTATNPSPGDYATEIDGLSGYWTYAVYDGNGDLEPMSQVISASVFELPASGYTVVWKYGSWSFEDELADEIDSWD